jgi:hypothetical protein
MTQRTAYIWMAALAATVVLTLPGCSSRAGREAPERSITEGQALEISRVAARAHGYDLKGYRLDTFGDRTGGGDKEWLIVYLCSPGPPPPGCSFMVVVDRRTGDASVHAGQ